VPTCKEPAADAVSGPKPEHETKAADAAPDQSCSREGFPRSTERRTYLAIVLGSSKRGDARSATPQQDTAIGKRKSSGWTVSQPRSFRRQPCTGSTLVARRRAAPHQEGSDTGWHERDYQQFVTAIRSGRLEVLEGV